MDRPTNADVGPVGPSNEKMMAFKTRNSGGGGAPALSSIKQFANRDLVLAAVRQDGMQLKFASDALKADREIVAEAVAQNPHAIEHAASCIYRDPMFLADVTAATKIGPITDAPKEGRFKDLAMKSQKRTSQWLRR